MIIIVLLASPLGAQDGEAPVDPPADTPADPPADTPTDTGGGDGGGEGTGDGTGDGTGEGAGDGAGEGAGEPEGETGTGEDGEPNPGPADGDGSGDDIAVDPDVPPPAPVCPPGLINASAPTDPVRCEDPAEIARLLGEYEAAAAEETEALISLAGILDALDELNAQLEGIRAELGATQLQEAAAQADAAYAELRGDATRGLLVEVEDELTAEEDRLRAQAVAAYVGGGTIEANVTNALLDAENLSDASIAREYSSAVLGDQLFTLDVVNELREEVVTLTAAVAEVERLAGEETLRVEDLKQRVGALLDDQKVLVVATEEEAKEVATIIGEIQAQKQAFADELQISAAGGGQIGDILRQVQSDQEPPDVVTGILAVPVDPTAFGSGFGPRFHPIFHISRMHTGIDFSGSSGQQILSSADGMVVVAEAVGGYGNVIVVEHGNGLASLYAHQTAFAVAVGDVVEQGDLLGFVGSTGFSTGPHLHYEVRLFGMPVDPMPYLDLTGFDVEEGEGHSESEDDEAGFGN